MKRWRNSLLSVSLCVVFASPALAQSEADFFKGKQVSVLISSDVGGGYDAFSRTISRHMSRHLPGNPTLVPQNMPGASGVKAANFLQNGAARDGTVFAGVQNTVPFAPLMAVPGAQFEALKMGWVGNANSESAVAFVWHTSSVQTFDDLKSREVAMASSGGATGQPALYARMMNKLLGTKIKLILGYPGSNQAMLALERGEVEGYPALFWSSMKATKPDWIAAKSVRLLVQIGLSKHPELQDVPLALNLAQGEENLQVLRLVAASTTLGRPYVAPPGLPAARLATLRAAFMATMKDPEFLADIARQHLEVVEPMEGGAMAKVITEAYASTPSVVKRLQEIQEPE
jgi:tripartite-type tricarboxylate transporter receptor subunit TctC